MLAQPRRQRVGAAGVCGELDRQAQRAVALPLHPHGAVDRVRLSQRLRHVIHRSRRYTAAHQILARRSGRDVDQRAFDLGAQRVAVGQPQ